MDVGDALIKIKAEDKTKAAFDKVNKSTQNMSANFRKAGLAMVAMSGAMVAGLMMVAKSFAEAGDQIEKMSRRTSFATETLSELKYAAEISGTTLESIEKAAKKMSKTIIDASDGMATYIRAFDRIGLSAENLLKLSPEEQFIEISQAIADLENPTERAATAIDIFGRAGTELLPLLEDGAEGIKKLREEAHKFAPIFSEEAAKAAAEFQDRMLDLKGAINKVKMGMGEMVVKDLTPLIEKLGELASKADDVSDSMKVLGKVLGTAVIGGAGLLGSLLLLGSIVPTIGKGIIALKAGVATLTLKAFALNMTLASLIAYLSLLFVGITMVIGGVIGLIRNSEIRREQEERELNYARDMQEAMNTLANTYEDVKKAAIKTGEATREYAGGVILTIKYVNQETEALEALNAALKRQFQLRLALMRGMRAAVGAVGVPVVVKALEEYEEWKRETKPSSGYEEYGMAPPNIPAFQRGGIIAHGGETVTPANELPRTETPVQIVIGDEVVGEVVARTLGRLYLERSRM